MRSICQNCRNYIKGFCDISGDRQDPQDSCEDFSQISVSPSCENCVFYLTDEFHDGVCMNQFRCKVGD